MEVFQMPEASCSAKEFGFYTTLIMEKLGRISASLIEKSHTPYKQIQKSLRYQLCTVDPETGRGGWEAVTMVQPREAERLK